MVVTYAALLIIVAFFGLLMTLVGLPGNWLMVVAVAVYVYFTGDVGRADVGLRTAVAVAVLAVAGELLEFVAGAYGAKRAGGSRRAAALALTGSMIGGIAGAMVGLPIPVVGSIVAAVFFAGLGALVGALSGELWKGRSWEHGMAVGRAAFHGRLMGILAKLAVGLAMFLIIVAALLW